ncbi:MAG: type I-E CRISPR-associated protein Cse1/CasA [Saccharofermentanales bacterium]|jgi:CRISPR system Cascade subunit CasA
MSRFNLIDKPWISVVLDEKGQTELVSLNLLFENAHIYKGIAGDTKTQDFAVFRVILAVLHTVFSRFDAQGKPYIFFDLDERYKPTSLIEDEDDLEDYSEALYQTWEDLWQTGIFPEIVNEYLEKWYDRFYLLDNEFPFFQVTQTEVAPDNISKNSPSAISGKNINRLVSESGNKTALFSPKTMSDKAILSEAECARWLLAFQGYTGLADKVIFGKEKYKASKGWLFDIGGLVVEGRNLFETLMLNLVLIHSESEYQGIEQKPCWEFTASEMIEYYFSGLNYDNLAALYTNWSRAIYIEPSINFEKSFECHIVKLPEIKHNDNFLEPMTIWQMNRSGPNKDTFTPKKHQVNQSIWRSFGLLSLPNAYAENQWQPGIIDWINRISEFIGDYDLTLRAVSMKDDGNATSWVPVDEATDKLRINDLILSDVKEKGWVPRISDTVEETKKVVEDTFKRLLLGIKEIRNIESYSFVNEEVEKLYFQINQPFYKWLSELRSDDNKDERIFEWRKMLKTIVLRQVEQLMNNAGPRDYMGIIDKKNNVINIATVYNSFIYFLNQQLRV